MPPMENKSEDVVVVAEDAVVVAPPKRGSKKRTSATKKRPSRKKSLDLSCPMMTLNRPNNVIQNKEKRWYKGKQLPTPPGAINMHASFTALSINDEEDTADGAEQKMRSKSVPHLMFEDGCAIHVQDEGTETEGTETEECSLVSH